MKICLMTVWNLFDIIKFISRNQRVKNAFKMFALKFKFYRIISKKWQYVHRIGLFPFVSFFKWWRLVFKTGNVNMIWYEFYLRKKSPHENLVMLLRLQRWRREQGNNHKILEKFVHGTRVRHWIWSVNEQSAWINNFRFQAPISTFFRFGRTSAHETSWTRSIKDVCLVSKNIEFKCPEKFQKNFPGLRSYN